MAIVKKDLKEDKFIYEGNLPDPSSFNKFKKNRLMWYFKNNYQGGAATLVDDYDLELSVEGFIHRVVSANRGSVVYAITPKGEAMVYKIKQHNVSRRAPHHELGSHLAQYLDDQGKMVWENISFEVEFDDTKAFARPDVFCCDTTLNPKNWNPIVYEVKVSRSDFKSDVNNPEKRKSYFALSPKVFYATPYGLIKEEEVPSECGWIEQSADGNDWVVKKKAPKMKGWKGWTERMWLTLVLRSKKTEFRKMP